MEMTDELDQAITRHEEAVTEVSQLLLGIERPIAISKNSVSSWSNRETTTSKLHSR